jgi:hypothetical protein
MNEDRRLSHTSLLTVGKDQITALRRTSLLDDLW